MEKEKNGKRRIRKRKERKGKSENCKLSVFVIAKKNNII